MAKEKLRPALQPAVTLADVYETGKGAEVTVALEVLPEIATPSIDGLKLERLTVPADDKAVMAKIEEFAAQMKRFEDAPKTRRPPRATRSSSTSQAASTASPWTAARVRIWRAESVWAKRTEERRRGIEGGQRG